MKECSKDHDHSKPIYFLCRKRRYLAEAQSRLRALGVTNVINVVGGLEAWRNEDLPVEREEPVPWSFERQFRFA